MPPRSLDALTGLRFFAALHVVLFHFVPRALVPTWSHGLLELGPSAVTLFFVLSGFVMRYSYTATFSGGDLDVGRFSVARLARIYPVFLLATAVAALFDVAGDVKADGALSTGLATQIVTLVLMVQAWHPATAQGPNGPSWSLSAEMFFYVVFVMLARWGPARRAWGRVEAYPVASATVLWVFGLAYSAQFYGQPEVGPAHWLRYFFPLARLPEFLTGVLTGALFVRAGGALPDGTGSVARRALRPGPVIVALGAAYLFAGLTPVDKLFAAVVLVPLYAVLVYVLAAGGGRVAGALGTRAGVLLGGGSYALYLLHYPFYTALTALNKRTVNLPTQEWAFVALFLVAVNAASLVVFVMYEEPVRERIRAWYAARRTRAAQELELA